MFSLFAEPADSDSLRFSGHIPVSELEIRATSGASGPGGQNVNKSPTKVEIRFNLQKASWLTDSMKEVKIRGYIVVRSNQVYSQRPV